MTTPTPGVGPVTTLAYIATIDDSGRFGTSKALGAHLGPTPRVNQSGEIDRSGQISKCGDRMQRHLLYEAASGADDAYPQVVSPAGLGYLPFPSTGAGLVVAERRRLAFTTLGPRPLDASDRIVGDGVPAALPGARQLECRKARSRSRARRPIGTQAPRPRFSNRLGRLRGKSTWSKIFRHPQRWRNTGAWLKSCGTWQLKCGFATHATNSSTSPLVSIGWPPIPNAKFAVWRSTGRSRRRQRHSRSFGRTTAAAPLGSSSQNRLRRSSAASSGAAGLPRSCPFAVIRIPAG